MGDCGGMPLSALNSVMHPVTSGSPKEEPMVGFGALVRNEGQNRMGEMLQERNFCQVAV